VLGALLMPVLALGLYASEGDQLLATARFDGLILLPAALVAAIACNAAWRITSRPGLAWATIGLALLASQELIRAAVQLVGFPEPVPGLWVLAADVTTALVVLVAITVAQSVRRRPDPVITGFAIGAVVAALRLAWLDSSPDLGLQLPRLLVCLAYVAALVTGAALLSWGGGLTPRLASIPLWARQRTALAVLMIGGAHLALYVGDNAVEHVVDLVGMTVGAVLLWSTYLALLVREVDLADRTRSNLDDDLMRTRRRGRAYQAKLHEINASIAGISSASWLLRSPQGVNGQRRILLEDMIATELSRLARLMTPPDPTGIDGDGLVDSSEFRPIDLDETMGTLVVSQEARGNRVSWSPSGLRVSAQPDAVAEVISVLLDNAAKHGRSAAELIVSQIGDTVEIAVHDDGPGVEESLRSRLFTWGARGPSSTGQGIGLHIAHELAERQGGYLELRDSRSGGATFVMGLPLHRADDGESAHDDELEADPA
jgi:signal transduction histidine kinase